METSTISGNSAAFGGGVGVHGRSATIVNSTIANNNGSGTGGGINVSLGTLNVINSTITANSAPNAGFGSAGGIQLSFGPAVATLTNTIVAGQTVGSNCNSAPGAITDGGYNLEDGTSCGLSSANHSFPSTNPLLDPAGLQDNGGLTKTIALLSGSPALNTIPTGANGCGTTIASDQRGVSRPQGSACDTGAFELEEQSAEALLAQLALKVQGAGPGTSLIDKVTTAQTSLAAGDVASTCIALTGFSNQVKAHAGKTIPAATASMLLTDAATIKTLLGC
jgi:hypothetical protein